MTEELLDLKVVRTGREYAGLSRSQILKWIDENRLTGDDLVKSVGARKWWRISMAAEILGVNPGPSPVANQARWQVESSDSDDLGIEAPAKSRPRKKLRFLEDSVMDMTPMIDVTFQMLIFFMFTNQLANPTPMDVPEATYGRGVQMEGKQTVLIDEQGRFYFGEIAKEENIEPSLESLIGKIKDRAASSEIPFDVVISAHKNSKHLSTRQLMEELSKIENVQKIRLGVEEKQ